MTNIYAIRVFRENYGDIEDIVKTFMKVCCRLIITEEINPYQHYHMMVWSDKTLAQVKKFVSNHMIKMSIRIRRKNNTDCEVVQNIPAYERYIKKDYVRGFDTHYGWMVRPDEYNNYDFDNEPSMTEREHIEYISFLKASENNISHIIT